MHSDLVTSFFSSAPDRELATDVCTVFWNLGYEQGVLSGRHHPETKEVTEFDKAISEGVNQIFKSDAVQDFLFSVPDRDLGKKVIAYFWEVAFAEGTLSGRLTAEMDKTETKS